MLKAEDENDDEDESKMPSYLCPSPKGEWGGIREFLQCEKTFWGSYYILLFRFRPKNHPTWKAGQMPPGTPLSTEEEETLRAWVAAGAAWSGTLNAGGVSRPPFSCLYPARVINSWMLTRMTCGRFGTYFIGGTR